jgi:hypothetical protein
VPTAARYYLGLTAKWVDGTAVGGCSFMIHIRHAAAAIASGLCETVLITHGESGRSGVGRTRNVVAPTSLAGQFEQPHGPMGPPTLFTIPVLLHEDLWPDARAIGDGLGRAARLGGEEPVRHPSTNPRGSHSCSGIESTTSRLADGRSLGFVKVRLGTSPPRSPMSSLRAAVDGTGAGSR